MWQKPIFTRSCHSWSNKDHKTQQSFGPSSKSATSVSSISQPSFTCATATVPKWEFARLATLRLPKFRDSAPPVVTKLPNTKQSQTSKSTLRKKQMSVSLKHPRRTQGQVSNKFTMRRTLLQSRSSKCKNSKTTASLFLSCCTSQASLRNSQSFRI